MTEKTMFLPLRRDPLFAAVIILLLIAVLAAPADLVAAPQLVAVPQVSGLTGVQAKQKMEALGLKVTLVENFQPTANPGQQGKVSHATPVAGTKVAKGSVVTVYTYRYSADAAVPNVVGMTVDKARLTIEQAGLQFKLAAKPTPTSNQTQAGKVAAQNPAAGSRLARGKAVQVSPFAYTGAWRK